MARRYENKVVAVTGASSGIGAACAREFARQGACVALAARREQRLARVKADIEALGGQAKAVTCDVTRSADVDRFAAETADAFGRVDVVLANAGFGVSGAITKLHPDDFRRQFEVNFFGVIHALYAFLPALTASRGVFAIMSSTMGRVGLPASAPYNASKFAVAGLADSIYHDLDELGVGVTLICPGLVESEIRSVDNQGVFRGGNDTAPRRLTMPAEVAARQIARAIARRRFELVLTRHGKTAVWLTRHFPRTARQLVRLFTRGRLGELEQAKRADAAR